MRPGPPGVVRLRPLLAGRQDLPGWGMAARSAPCGGRFAARSGAFADALFSAAFCRRPFSAARPGATVCRHLFADVLFSAARPFGAAPLFFVPDGTVRSAPPLSSLPPLVSAPSPLRPLSALPRPRPVPSPFLSRSCPVPVPFQSPSLPRPCPVPAPSLPRPCPVPAPSLPRSCPVPVPFLSRSCPLSAPSRSRPVPVPVPSFGGAPLRRFFSVRGLKNRKNCLDL